jgi:glycosyltransferase involved in cell wall biosynthesis
MSTTTITTTSTRAVDEDAIQLDSLSIVLPCFNEQDNVVEAITQARCAAIRYAFDYEVIVVDDGSSDETRAVADAVAARCPSVHVVAHDHNRGYGAAVRTGIAASRSTWVLLTDADLQFDLGELRLMLPLTIDHDLVAGYRIDRADPPARRFAAHAWNRLMRHSFGVAVRDVDCAFKLIRGDAVRALDLRSDGAMVSTELLVRAAEAGMRFGEVGVHHRPRIAGDPTGGDPRVVVRAFRERRALLRGLADTDRQAARERGWHTAARAS